MHPNTVRNKIRAGEIPAREHWEGGRRVYRVPESYVRERLSRDRALAQPAAQKVADRVAQEVKALLAEQDRRQRSERQEAMRRLRAELDGIRKVLDRLTARNEDRK